MGEWERVRDRATRLEDSVWGGRTVHDDAERLRASLREGREDDVLARLVSARAIRALTWLWVEVEGDCRETVTTSLLVAIDNESLSRGALHFLARLYLERYDQLDADVFETLRTLLLTRTNSLTGASGILRSLSANNALLLDPAAPKLLARKAKSANLGFSGVVREIGLAGFLSGRFGELLRQYLVLEDLMTIPMDVHHGLLEEVLEPTLLDEWHTDGLLFGHAILAIMIDRVGDDFPSEPWANTVLTIAPDPRLTHTASYQKWWKQLGTERIATAISWLAKEELEAFLSALKRFAEEDEDGAMARMFPPRKLLLEGLLREKRVVSSRLYLGHKTRWSLRDQINGFADVPTLEGPSSADKALIYLDCGDFYIVEGSHNTQLWAYLLTPPQLLTDQTRRRYKYRELTAGAQEAFDQQHKTAAEGKRFNMPHQVRWQFKFLENLAKNDIYVDPEAVLSQGDYRRFRASPAYLLSAALRASIDRVNTGEE